MKGVALHLVFFATLLFQVAGFTRVHVGVGKAELTPPIGTPSAGYSDRKGEGMEGVHDPLLSIALYIDNGEKKIVLCSVDHLGFTYEMVQEITRTIQSHPELSACEVFVASSHTHSGGGAYLNIPVLGEALAGSYSPKITQFYIDKTCESILLAYQGRILAKVGFGYGKVEALSFYRALWPKDIMPPTDVSIIKVTDLEDAPYAALFNFPVHPTVLNGKNRLFSSDFVGYARDYVQEFLGVKSLYFNGAQGDIIPVILNEEDRFESCNLVGKSLAKTVKAIWDKTKALETLDMVTQKETYSFKPQATPYGVVLPVETYKSEINLVVFNQDHAFITIPGELSCLYDQQFKKMGETLGFSHVSIWGLTNDAHGYIITPEAWQHKTYESALSFGGEQYGEAVKKRVEALLKASR